MNSLRKALGEDPEALLQRILEQMQELQRQREENKRLQGEVERLIREKREQSERIERLEREMHRQAAPFRIAEEKRVQERKRPGRKAGHAPSYRKPPAAVDETLEVPLESCPHCGGALQDVTSCEQIIEEIPVLRPRVYRVVTHTGRCPCCGEVRSTHPLQTSTAQGAAGTPLGPGALGVASELAHRHGLGMRRACRILESLFGLRLSPGGLAQATQRLAGRLHGAYEALGASVRQAAVAHADETGWWVGQGGWQLWVFATEGQTLYRVCPTRGREVVYETLGTDYGGVLVSDCLSVYDEVCPIQQKCYAHHHRAIAKAIERHAQGGEGFLRDLQALLRAAQALKSLGPELPPYERQTMRGALEENANRLLLAPRGDPLEESVANRLRKQRDHLFTFLDHPAVPATNNRAERQLRPAVIARKLSCGNRTPKGAAAWEVLSSLAATAAQNRQSYRSLVENAARIAH